MKQNKIQNRIPFGGHDLPSCLFARRDYMSDTSDASVRCYSYHGLYWYVLKVSHVSVPIRSFGFVGRRNMMISLHYDLARLGFRPASDLEFLSRGASYEH